MPERPRPLTPNEIRARAAQKEGRSLLGSSGLSSTFSGPSQFQEEQGQGLPTAAAGAIGEAATQGGEAVAEQAGFTPEAAEGMRFAPIAGSVAGAKVLPGAVRAIAPKVIRLASGNILRAGSPLMGAGVDLFLRTLGAGGGGWLGGEATKPIGETSSEAIERRILDAGSGVAGELAFPVGKKIVRFVRDAPGQVMRHVLERPAALPKVVEGAHEIQSLLASEGATATAGQLRRDWPTRMMENILSATATGGGRYAEVHEASGQAARRAWNSALPQFGRQLSDQQVGQVVDDAIIGSQKAQQVLVRSEYRAARQLAASRGVSDDVVFLDDVYRQYLDDSAVQTRRRDPVLQELGNILDDLVDSEAMPLIRSTKGSNMMPVSFEQAETIRSTLNSLAYSTDRQLIKGSAALVKPYAKAVDDAIEQAASRLNVPEVRAAYQGARAVSKENFKIFNDDIIAELIGKRRPEQVADALIATGSPSRIQALWKITENPNFYGAIQKSLDQVGGGTVAQFKEAIQNAYLSRTMLQAGERMATSQSGVVYAEPNWKTAVSKLTASRGTFEAMFPDPAQRKGLELIARAGQMVQSKLPTNKVGQFFFQMKQAGVAADTAAAIFVGGMHGIGPEAIGILVLPGGMASMATSKRFVDWQLKRATVAGSRKGALAGRALTQWASSEMAKGIDLLRQDGTPFVYVDPSNQVTRFDPAQNPPVQGQYAPSGLKPQSKF